MDAELIEAARAAIDAGQVTQDGKPLVTAMEAVLGRDVTADERDQAFAAIRDEGADYNRSADGIRNLEGLESDGQTEPMETEQADPGQGPTETAGQVEAETKTVSRLVYTGPNTMTNGVPVLKGTVFIGGLPWYAAGLEKNCKPLSSLHNKKH